MYKNSCAGWAAAVEKAPPAHGEGQAETMLESGENYLETILMLEGRTGAGTVHSVEVASQLGVTKASVSRAMSILREQGYITFETGSHITFTPKGRAKAEAVYERHRVITRFLVLALGVSERTAAADACRFEHDASEETFARMKAFVQMREAAGDAAAGDAADARDALDAGAAENVSDTGAAAPAAE